MLFKLQYVFKKLWMRCLRGPIYARYFARTLYGAFGFALFTFAAIFLFFDLINELNWVGQNNYTFLYAMARVALLAPSRFYEIIPVAALVSAVYVCATMAVTTEYTIWRISGLSALRAYGALASSGVPLVMAAFLIGEGIVPYTEQCSERMRLNALNLSVSSNFYSGAWVKDTLVDSGTGQPVKRLINVGQLMPDSTVRDIRIYEFDEQFQLMNIRFAQRGQFIAPNHWQFMNVRTTQLVKANNISQHARQMPFYSAQQSTASEYRMRSQLTPKILAVMMVAPDRMSLLNLFSYIQHLKQNGQDAQRYQITFWQKVLYPFSILIMFVLALPFAYLHQRNGGVGIKVFGGLMLGVSFQLFNTLFAHLGLLNTWPAFLTAMLPSIVYLILGVSAVRWIGG